MKLTTEIRFHCLHYHRRTQPLSPSPNTWPFLEQTPMFSSFKSILPSDNNEKTTIVFDWRDRAIAKWLEVRLWWKRCTCCLRRRPEEGCFYGATLRLNRSEWTLQQLVKTRRFHWINVRRIKLYMFHCWHRWYAQSVFYVMRWMCKHKYLCRMTRICGPQTSLLRNKKIHTFIT